MYGKIKTDLHTDILTEQKSKESIKLEDQKLICAMIHQRITEHTELKGTHKDH